MAVKKSSWEKPTIQENYKQAQEYTPLTKLSDSYEMNHSFFLLPRGKTAFSMCSKNVLTKKAQTFRLIPKNQYPPEN